MFTYSQVIFMQIGLIELFIGWGTGSCYCFFAYWPHNHNPLSVIAECYEVTDMMGLPSTYLHYSILIQFNLAGITFRNKMT